MGNVESMYYYAKTCQFIIKNNYKYNTEFDINNYLNYLKKAALNGHKESIKEYLQLILENKVHLEKEELKKWLEEGIKLGMHTAMFKYGLTIKDEDERRGLFYLREAARKGNVDAISLLHYINLEKKSIKERSYEYFKKDADKYKQILLNYRSNNYYQFVDDKYPPESNWKRIDEVYKAPLFQKNLIDPGFIRQGYVGDCYFISALCSIANNTDLVHELFEYKLPNEILGVVDNSINIKCGAVVIYFHAFGRITPVLIDTYIPLQENGKTIISNLSNKRKSPWFILVEKAFAKLSGSFRNIYGGSFSISLYNLCFYYHKKIEITILDIYKNTYPKYYEEFTQYINNGYFIGCAIQYTDAKQGLVAYHLYSVFQTKKINDVKLFLLRNPWGHQEWNGDFSRSSVSWNFKLKKELNYDNLSEGYFWIPEKDFKKYFRNFIIAKPIPSDCKIKMFHCKIMPSNHFGAYFENDEDETFGIRIVKPIQKDEKCQIHFIVEYQSSSFTEFYKDLNNYFFPSDDDKYYKREYHFIIADTKGKNLRYNSEEIARFRGLSKVESFCYDACNNNVLSVWIRRLVKSDLVLNFYVTVFCQNEFELFNLKNPEIKFPDIQNNHIYK